MSLDGAGDYKSTLAVYAFFLVHMLAFGWSGFFMAYSSNAASMFFLYVHGGLAIGIYLLFYLAAFGPDEVKWMFINASLGIFGIYAEIDWILSRFGTTVSDYPVYIHVIPFSYYVLYTFLLRQAVVDLVRARNNKKRRRIVETLYVVVSLAVYGSIYFSSRA